MGRYRDALKSMHKVLELDPNHAEAWFHKGQLLWRLGYIQEGIEALKVGERLGHSLARGLLNKITFNSDP